MLVWNEDLRVGVPEIDEAHQHFINLINDLNRSMTEGMGPAEILNRLQLVIDDAERHFSHEEALFRELNYPDAYIHTQFHTRIMNELQTIKEKFIPYGMDTSWLNAGLMIKNILLEHIRMEDMKYADYYRKSKSKGVGLK